MDYDRFKNILKDIPFMDHINFKLFVMSFDHIDYDRFNNILKEIEILYWLKYVH